MKKLMIIAAVSIFMFGCSPKGSSDGSAIQVNDYQMSMQEFEQEYMNAKAIRGGTLESKHQFAQEIVTRKALLQEAQSQNLDKDQDFLKSIERFWEQSLLTLLLDRKSKELATRIRVSDEEIEDYFHSMPQADRQAKSLEDLRLEIRLLLLQKKQAQALDDWIDSVVKKSTVTIDKSITENK